MKKRIISIICIVMLIVVIYATVSCAAFDWNASVNNMITNPGDSNVINPVNDLAGSAITIAQVIAVGVAIVMLIVLAMKYMLAAPGEKATIKNHAVVYIIGAVVMFACTGILEIISNLTKALD